MVIFHSTFFIIIIIKFLHRTDDLHSITKYMQFCVDITDNHCTQCYESKLFIVIVIIETIVIVLLLCLKKCKNLFVINCGFQDVFQTGHDTNISAVIEMMLRCSFEITVLCFQGDQPLVFSFTQIHPEIFVVIYL